MSDSFEDFETGTAQAIIPSGDGSIASYREGLIKKHHRGSASLVERLMKDDLGDNESLLNALIEEIIGETDKLLGNEMVATENGELRDASVISVKRSEILEKAIKAVQSKRQFESESGIDLDSPSMVVIFKYFMQKVKDSFEAMDMPAEQSDIFFGIMGQMTENWKKELREEFDTLKRR
jgi:hypothetical protein